MAWEIMQISKDYVLVETMHRFHWTPRLLILFLLILANEIVIRILHMS